MIQVCGVRGLGKSGWENRVEGGRERSLYRTGGEKSGWSGLYLCKRGEPPKSRFLARVSQGIVELVGRKDLDTYVHVHIDVLSPCDQQDLTSIRPRRPVS